MEAEYKVKRYKYLKSLEKVADLKHSLIEFDDKTSPNYEFLYNAISSQKWGIDENGQPVLIQGYVGCLLEGSSRSQKTWSGIDIIIWLCLFVETNCTINIYRQTYNEFKTTLYDDFRRRLSDFDLPNPFIDTKEIKSFQIGKNTIFFLGDGKHGGGCDYAFYNELMEIPETVVMQSKMRCRKFWWADYNPSYTDHWAFDKLAQRPDVGFIRTTFRTNRYISANERNEILGYEPWEPGSYTSTDDGVYYQGEPISDTNQPPPHPTNIQNGTADEFMWKVYGLGLRGAMKGVIFPHVTWLDEFPDIAHTYGNDFGFTADPNALVKYGEDQNNIYFELLGYAPIETAGELNTFMEAVGVEKHLPITCDSSDKYTGENKGTVEMVKELRELGWEASKVSKKKSVMYWLLSMKKKKIHVVKNHLWKHVKKERENYKFKEVNGILINQPIDKYNHVWDSVRYAHMAFNSDNYFIV